MGLRTRRRRRAAGGSAGITDRNGTGPTVRVVGTAVCHTVGHVTSPGHPNSGRTSSVTRGGPASRTCTTSPTSRRWLSPHVSTTTNRPSPSMSTARPSIRPPGTCTSTRRPRVASAARYRGPMSSGRASNAVEQRGEQVERRRPTRHAASCNARPLRLRAPSRRSSPAPPRSNRRPPAGPGFRPACDRRGGGRSATSAPPRPLPPRGTRRSRPVRPAASSADAGDGTVRNRIDTNRLTPGGAFQRRSRRPRPAV